MLVPDKCPNTTTCVAVNAWVQLEGSLRSIELQRMGLTADQLHSVTVSCCHVCGGSVEELACCACVGPAGGLNPSQ